MIVLMLNDMRSAHYEDTRPVAKAETREELEQFLRNERVELYSESGPSLYRGSHIYNKSFRKGGPLEWFNQPLMTGEHFIDLTQKVEEARLQLEEAQGFLDNLDSIPSVESLG